MAPMQICLYRHALVLFKIFCHQNPEAKLVQMNFQLIDNIIYKNNVLKRQNHDVGKNILLNRLQALNNMMAKAGSN